MKRTLLAATAAMALLGGCDSKAPDPATQPATVYQRTYVQTPSETTHKTPRRIVYRKVDAVRIGDLLGDTAGDVITAQKPMQVSEGTEPGVNIPVAGGIETTAAAGGSWSSGGFKVTLWDRIVQWFRKMMWLGILGGVGLVVLFAIPYTRPIATAIVRIIASIVPVVGGAIEWIIGRFRTTAKTVQVAQIVDGGQRFKDAINASQELNDLGKKHVLALFAASHDGAQDKTTQTAVATAKLP